MHVEYLDIETSPNVVHAWGLWNQNIGINQIVEPSRMMCFAHKTRGGKTKFFAELDLPREDLVQRAWDVLDKTDVLVHFNGDHFDIPVLNSEFLLLGMPPPSPYKSVDLYKAYKKNFRLPSGKLAYISERLGLEGKVKNSGHSLWVRCMAGDAKAWKEMKAYNVRDVDLLEDLETLMLPWIPSYPNVNLYDDSEGCPRCGDDEALKPRGFRYTQTGRYQRYRCDSCGSWCSEGKASGRSSLR